MAYDEELAGRIRELLSGERGVTEKRMFGGLAFLVDGNMAVASSWQGGVLVRVAPDEADGLLEREHVEPMLMSGRPARGWVRVGEPGLQSRHQLQEWVSRGVDYARTLQPK